MAEETGTSSGAGAAVVDAPAADAGLGTSGDAPAAPASQDPGAASPAPAETAPPAQQRQRQESPRTTGADDGNVLDWRHFAPEEVRGDRTLQKFTSVADALKALVNLEHKMGGMVRLPGEDASPEEWQAYIDRVRPKSPADYTLADPQLPEGLSIDDDFRRQLTSAGYEAGVNSRQLQVFLNLAGQVIVDAHQRQAGLAAELEAEMKDELRRRYGADAPWLMAQANKSFEELARGRFGGEVAQRAREKWLQSELAHDPDMIVLLANLQNQLGEARYVDPTTGQETTTESLTARKQELVAKAMDDRVPWQEREAANQALQQLNRRLAEIRDAEDRRQNRQLYQNSR